MSMLDLLLILAVAVPCGVLAQLTNTFSGKGWLLHIGMAFAGGFLGVWVARTFDVPVIYVLRIDRHGFEIIWCLVGAVLMVAALGVMITPRRR